MTRPSIRLGSWHSRRWKLYGLLAGCFYLVLASYSLAQLALPSTQKGVQAMRQGQALLLKEPEQAAQYFQQASRYFVETSTALQQAPAWSKVLTPLPPFRWHVRLIKASYALSQAGSITSQLASRFPSLGQEELPVSPLLSQTSTSYFHWFTSNQSELTALQQELDTSDTQLAGIPAWSIFGQRQAIETLQYSVHQAREGLAQGMQLSHSLQLAFGLEDPGSTYTFLVLFQNDAELRPSGGFPGSYAVITATGGSIRQFQFGSNIYKLDKNLLAKAAADPNQYAFVFHPPPTLATLTDHWGFHDSSVDTAFLPESAQQMARFYQAATDTPVQGIIFTDTTVLEDFLRLTGPLPLPDSSSTVVDANTIRTVLTQEIEKNYFTKEENRIINEPKQIVADFFPILLKNLRQVPQPLSRSVNLLEKATQRKSLQFWSNNPALETQIESLLPPDQPLSRLATGRIPNSANNNWLKIVNTNLGGFKSSRSVSQHTEITTHPDRASQLLTVELTIRRRHHGSSQWPDGDNRNYLSIYLPKPARLLQLPTGRGGSDDNPNSWAEQDRLGVRGEVWTTEVNEGSDWQRVSCWASTKVGETSEYHLTYQLPLPSGSVEPYLIPQAGQQVE